MTTRTYSSPEAFKQALEQRLRSATKTGLAFARKRQLLGEPDVVKAEDVLAFAGIAPPTLQLYPIESHIAEKLHAYTMPRERPNSRVKDFPDIALLATVRDIDGAVLRAAIDKTFKHRATHPVPESVPEPPASWASVYAQIAKNNGLKWRTLVEVTEAVQTFLNPVLAGTSARWGTVDWAWRNGK